MLQHFITILVGNLVLFAKGFTLAYATAYCVFLSYYLLLSEQNPAAQVYLFFMYCTVTAADI